MEDRAHCEWMSAISAARCLDRLVEVVHGVVERNLAALGVRLRNHVPHRAGIRITPVDGRTKRTHQRAIEDLPEGVFVTLKSAPDVAYAIRGSHLLRWSANGYVEKIARPRGTVNVLTPPSIVGVLAAGYRPQWHSSANW